MEVLKVFIVKNWKNNTKYILIRYSNETIVHEFLNVLRKNELCFIS